MVPDEVRVALEALIGEYAQYVVLAFFILSVVLVNFRALRELWLELLPRRRHAREAQAQVEFAEKLCMLAEKQNALGLDLVDIRTAWDARFPHAAEAPARAMGPHEDVSRVKLVFYALGPFVFATFFLLLVGGLMTAVAVEIGVPEDAFTDALAIALMIMPLVLTVWGMVRTPMATWRKGYLNAMSGVFGRILWGGVLYFPLVGGLLYVAGVRL